MGMYWEGIKRVTVALFNGFIFVIAGGEETIKTRHYGALDVISRNKKAPIVGAPSLVML